MKRRGLLLICLGGLIALSFSGCGSRLQEIFQKESLQIKPLALTVETDGEGLGKDQVSFGSMVIELPEGWKVESRTDEEGITQCVLVDAHSQSSHDQVRKHDSLYEHDIVIAGYEAERLPEHPLQLLADLMNDFGLDAGRSFLEEGEAVEDCSWILWALDSENSANSIYFLLSKTKEGKRELFMVEESNLRAYGNDVEAFFDFVDQGCIRLENGGQKLRPVTRGSARRDFYRILNRGTAEEMLLEIREIRVQDQKTEMKISVYDSGKYTEPLTEFDEDYFSAEYMKPMDINGDGYEDFLLRYYGFPSEYSADNEDFEGYLWDTERETFVYRSGAELLADYRDVFLPEEKQEPLREEDKIPQDLIEYLSGLLKQDRDAVQKGMKTLVNDRELSEEELKAIAEKSNEIKNNMLEISAAEGFGVWVEADVDNDGIKGAVKKVE